MKKYDLSYYVTNFFTVHLPRTQCLSANTILSYRDTFSKLFQYFRDEKRIPPEKLKLNHFNKREIEVFLLWLIEENGCSTSTANLRLSAIRSFFSYIQVEAPEHMQLCSDVLSIHRKRCAKPVVKYLEGDGIKILLAQPDTTSWYGRRDLALLSVLYDSGARVQEICDLTMRSLRADAPATLKLCGKGDKSRYVSLSKCTAAILLEYILERGLNEPYKIDCPLFTNRQGRKLTRNGIAYILKKYVNMVNLEIPNYIPKDFSPHGLRHSKAMHMLEAGINLIYIRDFLGHEDVETTQLYAKANPEIKRKAIENAYKDDSSPNMGTWNSDSNLMSFLRGLSE